MEKEGGRDQQLIALPVPLPPRASFASPFHQRKRTAFSAVRDVDIAHEVA